MLTRAVSWRRVTGAVVATLIAVATTGAAASLGSVSALGFGAGEAVVARCDSDGVTTSYAISFGAVQSITLDGLAGACTNGSLSVVLAGAGGVSVASGGPVTVAGASATVPLSPQPQANTVTAVHVSITGP